MSLAVRVLHGLAAAEAATWSAMFQRARLLPAWTRRKRREVEHDHDIAHSLELPVPFALNQPTHALRAGPGPRSEWFVFQLRVLAAGDGVYDLENAITAWRALGAAPTDPADAPRLNHAQRAALRHLAAGVRPPQTGHDHARHADDSATVRAIAMAAGLSDPAQAEAQPDALMRTVASDAAISNAEDGVWVAKAAAALLWAVASGADPYHATEAALERLPADSWSAERARAGLETASGADGPLDLALRLDAEVANAAYSYGDVAPDVLAIALPIFLHHHRHPEAALLAALAVPRHAGAVAPLIGAWCAAAGYALNLSGPALERVSTLLGVALPQLRGVSLDAPTHPPRDERA